MNLADYRRKLENKKGIRTNIQSDIQRAQDRIEDLEVQVSFTLSAQTIINLVAEMTQKQLEYQISELVSLAMGYVFDDPYDVRLQFIPRRGKTDCTLRFERNGREASPMDQSGYGSVNIAGFGTRIGCYSLSDPRPRPVLLLDEPFPNLKGVEANARAIQMVKRVSDETGIQIIMVSDERAPLSEIENGADKVFYVSQVDGVSQFEMKEF